jgi:hypothetical protein
VQSEDEADYLCAILNSRVMTELMNPLQGRGQFGPRDFYGLPFQFPIPTYQAGTELHEQLRTLGTESRRIASSLPDTSLTTWRRARSAVLRALDEAGLSAQANDRVTDLLLA